MPNGLDWNRQRTSIDRLGWEWRRSLWHCRCLVVYLVERCVDIRSDVSISSTSSSSLLICSIQCSFTWESLSSSLRTFRLERRIERRIRLDRFSSSRSRHLLSDQIRNELSLLPIWSRSKCDGERERWSEMIFRSVISLLWLSLDFDWIFLPFSIRFGWDCFSSPVDIPSNVSGRSTRSFF